MAAAPVRPAPSFWRRGEHEVSLAQLYALRAVYLFFAVDGFLATLPLLLDHTPDRHLFLGVKGGLWLMGIVGVLHPLKVLPVLLFELGWKLVWLGFLLGNAALGAPNLTNIAWLYGGGLEDIVETIRRGRNGVMPAWRNRLGEENASLVAAWVYAQSRPAR